MNTEQEQPVFVSKPILTRGFVARVSRDGRYVVVSHPSLRVCEELAVTRGDVSGALADAGYGLGEAESVCEVTGEALLSVEAHPGSAMAGELQAAELARMCD